MVDDRLAGCFPVWSAFQNPQPVLPLRIDLPDGPLPDKLLVEVTYGGIVLDSLEVAVPDGGKGHPRKATH